MTRLLILAITALCGSQAAVSAPVTSAAFAQTAERYELYGQAGARRSYDSEEQCIQAMSVIKTSLEAQASQGATVAGSPLQVVTSARHSLFCMRG